jgi:hypothetical protein
MDEVALMEQISEGYTFYFLFDTKSSKKIEYDACVPVGRILRYISSCMMAIARRLKQALIMLRC